MTSCPVCCNTVSYNYDRNTQVISSATNATKFKTQIPNKNDVCHNNNDNTPICNACNDSLCCYAGCIRKSYIEPCYPVAHQLSISLSQRPMQRTRYCHLRSSAPAICSDWYSTGSTRPNSNWTTKFRSQWTSHAEPSATSTTVTGPVGEHLQAGTEE